MIIHSRLGYHDAPNIRQTLPPSNPTTGVLRRFVSYSAIGAVLTAWPALSLRASDNPWNFAVQVSASVDSGQHQVTLHWPEPTPLHNDGYVPEYTVYRKAVADLNSGDWGDGVSLPSGATSYTDTVEPGVAYEYKIQRHYSHWGAEYYGYGYIRTGIEVPLLEDRGTAILVVENGIAGQLGGSIDQLVSDLAGDGWRVVRWDDFSSGSNPADIRSRIRQEYWGAGANVQAVFLLGHLPIVMSGDATNPDGHFIRPVPSDGYYGEVNGDWGNATFDGAHWVYQKNIFPADVALEVGRVDFADMGDVASAAGGLSEVDLLRNYLTKDHAFRMAQRVPERRALIGDAFGEYYWSGDPARAEPFSANAYRTFAPLFGDRIMVDDNYHGDGSRASNWSHDLVDGSYLWAFGCGGGGDSGDSMASLGFDSGPITSTDFASRGMKAEFYLVFGSFVVDWSRPNNLMRATLAARDYGLACSWGGRPFLYYHAMGLGETVGYGLRISQNKTGTLYDTPVLVRASGNRYPQGVYIALMGDPTLRLHPVAPVRDFNAEAGSGHATWSAPGGVDVREYRVYRLNDSTGRYQLETSLGAGTTSYTPLQPGNYMVRVVTLENGSGTYYNASQGVFWSTSTGAAPEQFVAPTESSDTEAPAPPPSTDNNSAPPTTDTDSNSTPPPASAPMSPPPNTGGNPNVPWDDDGWWYDNGWWWP